LPLKPAAQVVVKVNLTGLAGIELHTKSNSPVSPAPGATVGTLVPPTAPKVHPQGATTLKPIAEATPG